MNVSLDGQPSHYLNITDPDAPTNFESNMTVSSLPVWSAIGLRDTQHTLILSSPTSKDGSFDFHVDGFMYVSFSVHCYQVIYAEQESVNFLKIRWGNSSDNNSQTPSAAHTVPCNAFHFPFSFPSGSYPRLAHQR
jgi:hypothetical protein